MFGALQFGPNTGTFTYDDSVAPVGGGPTGPIANPEDGGGPTSADGGEGDGGASDADAGAPDGGAG